MRKFLATDRAETAYERALVRHGIPHEYWYQNFKSLPFRSVAFGREKLTPANQRSGLRALASDPRDQLAIISSTPEEPALAAACCVYMSMLLGSIPCCLVSADYPKLPKRFAEDSQNLRAIVIHNLLAHATPERMQKVRDLLWRHRYTARVVVVTSTQDPYEFSTAQLGMRPTLCCLVTYPLPKGRGL